MMRETYVLRDGKLVPKHLAAPRNAVSSGPQVIGDTIEMWSPMDGKHYTSKSKYRAEVRARGLTEVGTERQTQHARPTAGDLRHEVARAVQMVREGYKPRSL